MLMVITMLEVAILLMQLALLPQILSLVMTVLMIINDNNCETVMKMIKTVITSIAAVKLMLLMIRKMSVP